MKKIALTLLFVSQFVTAYPQLIPEEYQVQLVHYGRMKRVNLHTGQRLQFQVEGQDEWHEGVFWGAGPQMVNLSGDSFPPNFITKLKIPMKKEAAYYNRMISVNLKKAALTYAGMQFLNRSTQQWTMARAAKVAIIGATLWTTSILLDKMRNREYNCRKKWKLQIRQPFRYVPGQQGQNREEKGQEHRQR